MEYPRTAKYDEAFINENMMGPNALKVLEESCEGLEIKENMRVLDLCCGRALTSIFLAKEFNCQVFATDLWIKANENFATIQAQKVEDKVIPIHCDALALPYANEYFDVITCIDGYHYFGREENFIDEKILPYLKKDGVLLLAFPGLKEEFQVNMPSELLLSWTPEDLECMHSIEWWKKLFLQSKNLVIDEIKELQCFEEAWTDWLKLDNPYSEGDRVAMEAGAGKHMNIISFIIRKI